MSPEQLNDLKQTALRVREHILRLSTRGGCFTGASLSCADLIVYLYKNFLNVRPENFDDSQRDYLFLSKGHDVPALYGTFVELGWMAEDRLSHHLKTTDSIYWHPNRSIPGVEFHSGSLGHLLPVAIGIAMDCKMKRQSNRVVVIAGDGELNEGSMWEACLVAHAYKLDNLVLVVDRNLFQANKKTEELIPLEPLEYKFLSFGFETAVADGHDFIDLENVFQKIPLHAGRPTAIIAETKRGKGLPSLEERADRWFCNFTETEIDQLLHELHTSEKAELKSGAIVAR